MSGMYATRYEIEPRPAAVGAGWRLRLFETDPETGEEIEMGSGVFPAAAYGSGEEASKEAYALALQTAQDWVESRPGAES